MKKTIWIILAVVIIIAGAGATYFLTTTGQKKTSFLFSKVERGNLESTVSCTGTLQFLHTENVASQVAGTVSALYTDFNQKVRQGQVLAVLDSSLLRLNVQDAENTIKKNKILLEQAQKDYNDTKDLFEKNFKSTNELLDAQYALRTAELNYGSAKTALDIARLNLQYATIRSPLTGVVIQRNVSIGDAVTANNTSSPMFIVATDIRKMQILASVDESDISKIKVGQKVYFTVQAYQDREFEGVVYQVRLEATTVQNVVTYSVVVNVNNPKNLLLPGMTATLDLVAESRTNVLKVPNSVFKFVPSQELVQNSFKTFLKNEKNATNSSRNKFARPDGNKPFPQGDNMGRNGTNSQPPTVLWTTNENGLRPIPVKKGFSDGVNIEISGKDLTEGLVIISGVETNKKAVKKPSSRSILGGGPGPGGPPHN